MSVLEESPHIEARQRNQATISRTIVRFLIGALLLFAAGMKGYELATAPVAGTTLLTTRWFLVAAVELELALGLCLLAGLLPKITWWTLLLCFAGFAAVTAHKAWVGEADCGCFGPARLDPRFTLALDLAVLVALLLARPVSLPPTDLRRFVAVGICLLAIGIPGGWLMASAKTANIMEDGLITAGDFVVLEPQKWVGKRFPLLKHIDIGPQLSQGKWIVVLYDASCSHCQVAIPKYAETARSLAGQASAPRLAMVEKPPYHDRHYWSHTSDVPWLLGQLDTVSDWFAQMPIELLLQDGTVVVGKDQGEGLTWWREEGTAGVTAHR